ncbi:MAG: hypothetical protein AAGB10_21365 [Pseudomonadota bacterium]
MLKSGTAALWMSAAVFALFFANVAVGAARQPVFLGDVAEMLTLGAASVLFVIGVLQREVHAKRNNQQS